MGIKPQPLDDNSRFLTGIGSSLLTEYKAGIAAAKALELPVDMKCCTVYITGTAPSVTIRGMEAGGKSYLDNAAAVDNGDGTVTIHSAGHGFADLSTITIAGTVNYNGSYTVLAASDANHLVITATYVAETIPATAYAVGYHDAVLTLPASGLTLGVDVAVEANTTFLTITPSAGTIDVAIVAVR